MNSKIFKVLYVFLFISLATSFFNLKKLPHPDKIVKSLYNEPIQKSETSLSSFDFPYKGKNYNVKPIADYELWGLVVSVNDIGAWYNMYHDKNSVNLKDICVVWGENLQSNVYNEVKYKSGEWTCYYSWFGKLSAGFRGNQLSNNHLFSDKEEVRNTIKKMDIGDQIHIKGTLSEYAEVGSSQYRKTSLNRNDSGNGACETIYVSQAEIIKKGIPDWKSFYEWSKRLLILTIVLHLIFTLFNTHTERKKFLDMINN